MKSGELARKILECIGGKENIVLAENCMTRLRISVKAPEKVNDEKIKALDGVLGVIHDEPGYIQIVLGPGKVRDVADEFKAMGINAAMGDAVEEDDWKKTKAAVKSRQNQNVVRKLRIIADIFSPMIPAFIASGISNGLSRILNICVSNGLIESTVFITVVINLLRLISNGFLSYLAIFTGVSAAKQFKVNPMLGGLLGAASINSVVNTISQAVGWYNKEVVNDSILSTGAGGIIGVVIGVWLMSKVEHWIHKHMPDALDITFTPLLTMFIIMPIYVLLAMPIMGWLSNKVTDFLSLFLLSDNVVVSAITGYISAALFLPLVLFGLHRGLVPIYAIQIENLGGTTLFPAVAMAGAGQVGAAIALYIKSKRKGNKRMMSVIRGALPAGILGIGEPLIYGVTLPMMKPFITAGLGAGFGGAYVMVRHVMSSAYSPSGILATTIMHPECMVDYAVGILISYVMGAVITYLFINDDDVAAV